MSATNARRRATTAYASMWSRVLTAAVGKMLDLELADRTRCTGRLEQVDDGRAVLTVDGVVRVIGLDDLLAVEEVECGGRRRRGTRGEQQ